MTIPEKRKPWMKWYPRDWRAEVNLMMCSRAARSLWMDMLGLMHESTLIGYLLINGKKPTPELLARVLGDDIQDMVRWLEELNTAGVYSETDEGVVYSRRMVRDHEMAEKGREDIKKRGGAWGKHDEKGKSPPSSPPNRVPTGDGITQRPEARGQSKDLVGPVPEPTVKPKKPNDYPEDFEGFWQPYPRNENMSKKKAFEVWGKLKKEGKLRPLPEMLRAVTGYRKFLADQSKNRATPYPAKHADVWLRGEYFESYLEAPAAPLGASIGHGWETKHPEWAKARAAIGDVQWNNWFLNVRPNGSPFTIVCATRFECVQLEDRFGDKLSNLFGQKVRFVMGEPTAVRPVPPAPPAQEELRH